MSQVAANLDRLLDSRLYALDSSLCLGHKQVVVAAQHVASVVVVAVVSLAIFFPTVTRRAGMWRLIGNVCI